MDGSVLDDSRSVQELGLSHGSLLTVSSARQSPRQRTSRSTGGLAKKPPSSSAATTNSRWNPFPDLAKDYHRALRSYQRKRKSGSSFGDLAELQSQLHVVDAQPEGPLKRVYLCRLCAERFCAMQQQQPASPVSTASSPSSAALLFGTLARERVDPKRKPKTSLSSTTDAEEYCHVAHVQAMWPLDGTTDPSALPTRSGKVAEWLGLQPVGWIFAYPGNRDDGVPVHGADVLQGARWQMAAMRQREQVAKASGGTDGGASSPESLRSAFVTLAMQTPTGATEAFQLSDVAVQMAAEGLLQSTGSNDRTLSTVHPIVVDGKETHELDSLLCLVHMALLSREGEFAGASFSSKPAVKKNGALMTKTRKALAAALDADDSGALFPILCDFQLLVALYDLLGAADCQRLCTTVKKWTRQKRGTMLEPTLKQRLKVLVEG